ncbi:MAG: hypothetical protein FWC75_08515 [Oscillospiraceae bacterium]|nr:hypothetical protein [Oscillospiraceae bacterium]
MKINRIVCFFIALAMIGLVTACGGSSTNSGSSNSDPGTASGGSESTLSGTPIQILSDLVDALAAEGVEMPMALPASEITPENSQNAMGLSAANFDRLVVSAANSLAAIGTFAHQIIVIEGNDARAAAEIKRLITSDGGYDPQKWICVWPERAVAVDSGAYVLLVASYNAVVDAAIEYFKSASGATGTVVTFWEFAGEQPAADGGIGGAMPLPVIGGG